MVNKLVPQDIAQASFLSLDSTWQMSSQNAFIKLNIHIAARCISQFIPLMVEGKRRPVSLTHRMWLIMYLLLGHEMLQTLMVV